MIPHSTMKNNRNLIEYCNNTHWGCHVQANKCALVLRTSVMLVTLLVQKLKLWFCVSAGWAQFVLPQTYLCRWTKSPAVHRPIAAHSCHLGTVNQVRMRCSSYSKDCSVTWFMKSRLDYLLNRDSWFFQAVSKLSPVYTVHPYFAAAAT